MYLAPQNIPRAISVLTLGNKVIMYGIIIIVVVAIIIIIITIIVIIIVMQESFWR